MLLSKSQQCLNKFTMLSVKGSFETDSLDIYLTTFSGVHNFGNISAMRVIFFWKCSKFKVDFENLRKNPEKAFCFWDNYVRNGCVKLSVLRREYLSSAVNVLTNSYKSLRLTKTDFFWLNYVPNDQ